jgi:CDP-diacylglycerol--glycerol-3-phosphate 3-phosphatidyltransferase
VPSASLLLADVLGVSRLVLAGALPAALAGGRTRPLLPAVVFVLAAVSDYVDGPLARRGGGPTRHGAILDNLADIAFVLAGTVTGSVLGLLPPAVPLSIALSFALYAIASVTGSARRGRWGVARSAVGHRAGVANYALTGLVTGAVVLPGAPWTAILEVASLVVVGINLAAVLERVSSALLARARAPHAAGTLARSGRSSA